MKRPRGWAFVFAAWLIYGGSADGHVRTVALSGSMAPGLPSADLFTSFSKVVLNDLGQVAFIGNSSVIGGVWSEGAGAGLELIARNNLSFPDGIRVTSFNRLVLNDRGQLVFEAAYNEGASPNQTGRGLWTSGIKGPLDLALREGQLAPNHPADAYVDKMLGQAFGPFFESLAVLNDAGQYAFHGLLRGPGIDGTVNNDKGLWWDLGGGIAPIAYSRDTTTGIAGGRDFVGLGYPTMNNRGRCYSSDTMRRTEESTAPWWLIRPELSRQSRAPATDSTT